MQREVLEHLEVLYGKVAAEQIHSRLIELLDSYRVHFSPPLVSRGKLQLSQKDAILITYGDQVQEHGIVPLRVLSEFCAKHLQGLISGIHILPFYPWTSDDGFSVKDYFAVDPALGDWKDIEQFGKNFNLMFDAVFNHMSAQSDWFQKYLADDPAYRDFFVSVQGDPDLSQVVRPRALPLLTEFLSSGGTKKVWTTFSADQVDLNFRNPEVLLKLIDALLFYVSKGAKLIRLDAIAFLWKEIGTTCLHLPQTHLVIQLMRSVLDEVAPEVVLITETNVPHVDNCSYFGNGRNEAQLVYNFALPPLVLHSIATGNAEKLTAWAKTLDLNSDCICFFNFLASHDGIGLNPARGILTPAEIDALVSRTLAHGGFISYKQNPDGSRSPYEMNINYFDALSDPASNEPIEVQARRFIVAQAILLALAGVPGIYFHSLFGSRGDRKGAESSGIPRRINRGKLSLRTLEEELADPQSLRSIVFNEMKALLSKRRDNVAFDPCGSQQIIAADPRLFVVLRSSQGGEEHCLCIHNISSEEIAIDHMVEAAAKSLAAVSSDMCRNESRMLKPYHFAWIALH